jgi:hypothetical protein
MQKEKACGYKKKRKRRKKWISARSRIRGKSPHEKRRKKNKDSPCFSTIIFKFK